MKVMRGYGVVSGLALLASLTLAGCGGGDSAGGSAVGAETGPAATTAADATTRAFSVTAVAGFETGLRRLAHIEDRLKLVGRGSVQIDYGGRPVLQTGGAAGLLYDCVGLNQRRNCDVYGTVTYDDAGTYPFTITYEPAGPLADTQTLTGSIVVEPPADFVIVSIGDSVASGEGSAQRERQRRDGAYWNDVASNYVVADSTGAIPGCHRSGRAGPASAARRIQRTNNATFIHIACTGGIFGNEDEDDRDGIAFDIGRVEKINLQLDWVRERVGRIDVIVLSGGANNIGGGFSQVINKCLLNNPLTPCSEDTAFRDRLREDVRGLAAKYRELNNRIRDRGTPEQSPSVVAITEYFDPTRDGNGNFPSIATSIACGLGAVEPREWRFLHDEMVIPLRLEVGAAAAAHDWVHVDGFYELFRTRGYCASATPGDFFGAAWIVKAPESLRRQGDVGGTGHPDLVGQGEYADGIYTAVVEANPPRTAATATTAGQPYEFGTWVTTNVEVTLSVRNPIRESGIGDTYFAPGEPICDAETVAAGACLPYGSPFPVTRLGRNVVSFFSTNAFGAPETRAEPVEVLIDRDPPEMTCDASPDEAWPPNRRMVDVTVSVTAVDAVSGPAAFSLVAIADSYGDEDSSIRDFELGIADVHGSVLSARDGNTPGRTYILTYESVDHVGNVGTCDAVVRVPHDQRAG